MGERIKKICFICPWMHVAGGLQRVVTDLANRLSANYDVIICIISMSLERPYYKLNDRIHVDNLQNAAFGKCGIMRKFLAKLSTHTSLLHHDQAAKMIYYPKERVDALETYIVNNNFDIVISSCGDLTLLLSLINKNRTNAKLIGWQHNSYDDYFRRPGHYYYGREKLAKLNYINLDKIVTLTRKDSAVYNKNMGINSIAIHNPITFTERIGSNVENPNILFVGRLDWNQKGLMHLFKITSQLLLKEKYLYWNLTIVGDGKDKTRLQKMYEKEGLDNRVRFVGNVRDVKSFYNNASIMLNTSNWEGFGLVIIEAMECGVPVVSFDTDGPSEIIVNGKTGYIIPKYSIEKFIDQMEVLMDNQSLRKEFSIHAKEDAMSFNIEPISNRWIGLFEELIQ